MTSGASGKKNGTPIVISSSQAEMGRRNTLAAACMAGSVMTVLRLRQASQSSSGNSSRAPTRYAWMRDPLALPHSSRNAVSSRSPASVPLSSAVVKRESSTAFHAGGASIVPRRRS